MKNIFKIIFTAFTLVILPKAYSCNYEDILPKLKLSGFFEDMTLNDCLEENPFALGTKEQVCACAKENLRKHPYTKDNFQTIQMQKKILESDIIGKTQLGIINLANELERSSDSLANSCILKEQLKPSLNCQSADQIFDKKYRKEKIASFEKNLKNQILNKTKPHLFNGQKTVASALTALKKQCSQKINFGSLSTNSFIKYDSILCESFKKAVDRGEKNLDQKFSCMMSLSDKAASEITHGVQDMQLSFALITNNSSNLYKDLKNSDFDSATSNEKMLKKYIDSNKQLYDFIHSKQGQSELSQLKKNPENLIQKIREIRSKKKSSSELQALCQNTFAQLNKAFCAKKTDDLLPKFLERIESEGLVKVRDTLRNTISANDSEQEQYFQSSQILQNNYCSNTISLADEIMSSTDQNLPQSMKAETDPKSYASNQYKQNSFLDKREICGLNSKAGTKSSLYIPLSQFNDDGKDLATCTKLVEQFQKEPTKAELPSSRCLYAVKIAKKIESFTKQEEIKRIEVAKAKAKAEGMNDKDLQKLIEDIKQEIVNAKDSAQFQYAALNNQSAPLKSGTKEFLGLTIPGAVSQELMIEEQTQKQLADAGIKPITSHKTKNLQSVRVATAKKINQLAPGQTFQGYNRDQFEEDSLQNVYDEIGKRLMNSQIAKSSSSDSQSLDDSEEFQKAMSYSPSAPAKMYAAPKTNKSFSPPAAMIANNTNFEQSFDPFNDSAGSIQTKNTNSSSPEQALANSYNKALGGSAASRAVMASRAPASAASSPVGLSGGSGANVPEVTLKEGQDLESAMKELIDGDFPEAKAISKLLETGKPFNLVKVVDGKKFKIQITYDRFEKKYKIIKDESLADDRIKDFVAKVEKSLSEKGNFEFLAKTLGKLFRKNQNTSKHSTTYSGLRGI